MAKTKNNIDIRSQGLSWWDRAKMFFGGWLGMIGIHNGIMLNAICIAGTVLIDNPITKAVLSDILNPLIPKVTPWLPSLLVPYAGWIVGLAIPAALMILPLLHAIFTGQFFTKESQKIPGQLLYSTPLLFLSSFAHIAVYTVSLNMGLSIDGAIGNAMTLAVFSSFIVVAHAHYTEWQEERAKHKKEETIKVTPKSDNDKNNEPSGPELHPKPQKTQTPGFNLYREREGSQKTNNKNTPIAKTGLAATDEEEETTSLRR